MSFENFVILILCTQATLDDLIHEREKHKAVAVDILNYSRGIDYFKYRHDKFDGKENGIKLMFVFGKNDSIIVKNDTDTSRVYNRLEAGQC